MDSGANCNFGFASGRSINNEGCQEEGEGCLIKDGCLLRILVIAVHFVLFISMRAKHCNFVRYGPAKLKHLVPYQ